MTSQGRRDMAYRHYVNKHVRERDKRIAKAQKAANRKLKHQLSTHPQPSEPVISSSVDSSDQVGTPMTVFSSPRDQALGSQP